MSNFVFNKVSRKVAVLGAITILAGAVAWADGQFDTTWGTNGNAHVSFGPSTDKNDTLSDALKQADGSYLVSGVDEGPNNGNGGTNVYIAQLNASGVVVGSPVTQDVSALVPSTSPSSVPGGISSVSIPADGKVLVTGSGYNPYGFFAVIARLNANGTTDKVYSRPNSTNDESGCDSAIGESASGVVIAGCTAGNTTTNNTHVAMLRLNNDLTPDTTFGTSGGTAHLTALPTSTSTTYTRSQIANDFSHPRSVAKDSSGNYYALAQAADSLNNCGSAGSNACNVALYVVKLNSTGQPVNSFGPSGNGTAVVMTASNPSGTVDRDEARGAVIAIESDGKILVGGTIRNATTLNSQNIKVNMPFVARLTAGGDLDTTFGETSGAAKSGIERVVGGGGGNGFGVTRIFDNASGLYALTDQNLYRLALADGAIDASFQKPTAYTANNTQSTDTSTWQGLYVLDATNALLLGGVNSTCVGNNKCNGGTGAVATSPNQATVSKVILVTPVGPDTTPDDPFAFTSKTNQPQGVLVRSEAITIIGIDSPAAISISPNTAYRIGCTASTPVDDASFTSNSGTITNNQTVCVRVTTATAPGTASSTNLTVGTRTAGFTATTSGAAADTTPDASVGTFTAVANAAISTATTSNSITITGVNAPTPISISGGTSPGYSIGCNGTFTTANDTIRNNESVCVRVTSSGTANTAVTTTLTVGTPNPITRGFTVTTGSGPVVNPSRLDFGPQSQTGSGVQKTLTLTNNSSSAASLSGIAVSGGNTTSFTQTNDCPAPTNVLGTVIPASIAAGASCTITVTFKPVATGNLSSAVTINTSPATAPSSVPLTGSNSATGELVFNPSTTQDFGSQPKGTASATESVVLTNTGNASVAITSILSSTNEFTETDTCPKSPASLAANANCTLTIGFTPAGGGVRTGSIGIISSASTNPSLGLTGNGLVPVVALAPNLTFTGQDISTTSVPQTVVLSNNGDIPLTSIVVTKTGDFAISNNACTATLAVGARCNISVTFTPTTSGTRSGTLRVTSNADSSPDAIALSGTGNPPPTPTADLSPTSKNFGDVVVNASSTPQDFALKNQGTAPLTINTIGFTGANLGDYSQTNTCGALPASLAAGMQCVITVTFKPTVVRSSSASLSVGSNAPSSTSAASLTGNGIAVGSAAVVSLSTNQLTFTSQALQTTSPAQTVTLTNSGNATMTITSIATSGDFAKANSSTCGATLASGANCAVNVTFSPTAVGTRNGALTFNTNAASSSNAVGLTGTGANSGATVSTPYGNVTLTTDQGTVAPPVVANTPDAARALPYNYPVGFLNFQVTGVTPGSAVHLTYTLPAGLIANTYVKCKGTVCAVNPTSNASADGKSITFTVIEGGPDDTDGAQNGTLVDPGAPAFIANTNPTATATTGSSSSGAMGWETLLLMGVPALLRSRRRKLH